MPDPRHADLARLVEPFRVEPGRRVRLPDDFDPRATGGLVRREEAPELLDRGLELLAELQARLAAEARHALLVVFQGIDAAGKDGTIRHVMRGVNPQGVRVTSFREPSRRELAHDFLWRVSRALPARGEIGILNRSHYEEVLVVRVHPELLDAQRLPEASLAGDLWERRFRQVNDWERHLAENGTTIVKLFLHLSREEQRARFLSRIDEPEKHWKFSADDVRERRRWDDFQAAFADMLSRTSTPWAPWHVIPADRKWFMRLASAAVIVEALMRIDPQWPVPDRSAREAMQAAREELLAEGRDTSTRSA
jgi:PPK2 family polyphosphate:nucleotide phosphotransferase